MGSDGEWSCVCWDLEAQRACEAVLGGWGMGRGLVLSLCISVFPPWGFLHLLWVLRIVKVNFKKITFPVGRASTIGNVFTLSKFRLQWRRWQTTFWSSVTKSFFFFLGSKCLTLLVEIHPVNNVKVLKAVDSYIWVQVSTEHVAIIHLANQKVWNLEAMVLTECLHSNYHI